MDKQTEELIREAIGYVKKGIIIYVLFWLIPALAVTACVIYLTVNFRG